MAKKETIFVCQNCGASFPKWQGQCLACGQWNTLVETSLSSSKKSDYKEGEVVKIFKLKEIKAQKFFRFKTGIEELDRVLGGGIVSGSLVLVAGEPGIGKSTLLTQLALLIINQQINKRKKESSSVVYVCGEESPQQIKLRINRLLNNFSKKEQNLSDNFLFLPETSIENILTTISHQAVPPQLIIIDSIQTLWSQNLGGTPGSVGQVAECSNMLLNLAKKTNIPIFLIGHITKEGVIAGPKILEHLVDAVLYLEGDRQHDLRILRCYKNRFGPTDEVGVFQITEQGIKEIPNPAEIFLSENNNQPGSSVVCSMQGVRPLMVEIQALVVPSQLAIPRRIALGIDLKKLQVLTAVIQKKLGLPLGQSDVFVNVAGGLKVNEPAADLAVCMAIISSFKNKPLPSKSVCLGEVDLLGKIRKASFWEKRVIQSRKLGYNFVIGEKETSLRQAVGYLV